MQKAIILFMIVSIISSCVMTDNNISKKRNNTSKISIENNTKSKIEWYDDLLKDYINKSNNELIISNRNDSSIKIEWILDRIENVDSAKYLVFQIGHDVVDEGSTNQRFVTDSWIYIDSIKRTIFEYDLPNDNLLKWRN